VSAVAPARRRPGVWTVYRWEARKLVAQKRTYLGFALAIFVPLAFVIALGLENGSPEDVPFGRYVRDSGLAIPLVGLVFGSVWFFPLIASLVAGDIVASEDQNGTLKTILTRSVGRGQVFAGKALVAITYAFAALVLYGAVGIVAGILASGYNPLVTLSGTVVAPDRALLLTLASFGVYLLPVIAIASIALLLSTATRNSAVAVVGTLMLALVMQLLAILPGLGGLQPYLLPEQFNAWQGLLRIPADLAPVGRAAWVSALYAVPSLIAAALVFLRRDVAGG